MPIYIHFNHSYGGVLKIGGHGGPQCLVGANDDGMRHWQDANLGFQADPILFGGTGDGDSMDIYIYITGYKYEITNFIGISLR